MGSDLRLKHFGSHVQDLGCKLKFNLDKNEVNMIDEDVAKGKDSNNYPWFGFENCIPQLKKIIEEKFTDGKLPFTKAKIIIE